jgi:hypothetical protein
MKIQTQHGVKYPERKSSGAVTDSRALLVVLFYFLAALLPLLPTAAAAQIANTPPADEFMDVVRILSSYEDRSTGSAGAEAAAVYIKEHLTRLGFDNVESQRFSVPVVRKGQCTLSTPSLDHPVSIHPLLGNAVTPQTVPAPGITGPLLYVGRGQAYDFNGKDIAGSIVLMELDSGKNWLYAADLGARALIYVDRGVSPKMLFEDKFELSPVQFPRFWMPLAQLRNLFGSFETAPDGRVSAPVNLISKTTWQLVPTQNIFCLVPGTDPKLAEQLVMVTAFYDSRAWIAGLSPGADEAVGVATLLELARSLKAAPPQRTVLLVATAGHAQALAGIRELVWSLSARSKDMRKIKKHLKALVKESRQTISALKKASFTGNAASGADPIRSLVKKALVERIKTEADKVSRQLMRLRMQKKEQANQDLIHRLAADRQLLRRLLWAPDFTDLLPEERQVLDRLLPPTIADQNAVLADARLELTNIDSARNFRGKVKTHDLVAAVSLHLSSHGDGFGAFNYGWMYPFRPRINRVAAYSRFYQTLRTGVTELEKSPELSGVFKDTLRPSRKRSWQSYFLDHPALGGEVTALAGYHGVSFVTTHDARAMWGTPFDTAEKVDAANARKQSAAVSVMIGHLAKAVNLPSDIYPRNGFSAVVGRAKFLRHGELFADQPAPGTVLLAYQGPARFYTMVNHMGTFLLKGVADKKHSFHKVIFEGYKFDPSTGKVVWTIDKKQTGKTAYRVKMFRRKMETTLIMFACQGITIFDLLEPRTFRYMTKGKIIDGRREADPQRYFYSRLDTWQSNLTTIFLEPGTPLKMTLSDSVLRKKLILLNSTPDDPRGSGYLPEKWPILYYSQYRIARDMWTLLTPRIANLEKRGIFNEQIRKLQQEGITELKTAQVSLSARRYDKFFEASAWSWALASRVYDDVEKTQKDVLYGVLFYIALFVPFAFCLERLLFCYTNIYKRIIAFCVILLLLIVIIYNVHPAFRLAYSPMVVILAFFIMGLSLIVTLIIFLRFEGEMARLQSRAQAVQTDQIGRWKAFVAAFLLGVSNLRRRRLRTALTCATLIILTFTIMSFTSAKSVRHHARLLYDSAAPYQGFLLKNVNWRSLPPEALGVIANTFADEGTIVPRVWLEAEDRTRRPRIPVRYSGRRFEAQGLVGLSYEEVRVSGLDKILIGGRWLKKGERRVVILPRRMAQNLGINPRHPEGNVITLWGMPFSVVGVFSAAKLQQLSDLDGEPLTPVTFPRELSTAMSEVEMEALESGDDVREFQSRYQHIPADLTMIIPYQTLMAAGGHLKAVAIRVPSQKTIQDTAQNLVDRFGLSLFSGESDGTYLYNASDTMSYSGVPNIIIPLAISIFIVLNTMIGSVYERKREIAIYTSVGLAPSHVSFLFVAEAMAFAVLSVVFGYLLAQTTARLFAETALWSGITVNYSSMAGVAAMVLVIAVVLISVIYPSRVAGQIAIPDVNRSWSLPPAVGNTMQITLPFLMTHKEHRSIGGFLYDYFVGHQDVSHGMFSTANVEFSFVDHDRPEIKRNEDARPAEEQNTNDCLAIRSRVWLAPFDFGIMQAVDLEFRPAADEPGFLEIHVKLTRLSGEANAWRRINKNFLHVVRRQLLVWRSFDDQNKSYYEQVLETAEKNQPE